MKTTTIIIRVLLGSLLLFGAIPYFFNLFPQPDLSGEMKTFNEGLNAAIYLMPLVKVIELICGLSFLFNRFVPLATIIIFPIAINILGVHIFLAPEGIPVAVFIMLSTLFIAIRNKDYYKSLFIFKTSPTVINNH